MVGWLNSVDVKEEPPVLYDDCDPLKEWFIDPEPLQLQSPCKYINCSHEPCGNRYSGFEIEQQDKTLESSINLKMENDIKLKISGGLHGEVDLKENGGGNDGEINCAKPGLEASYSDRQLQNPDPTQLQNPCNYINFSHEPHGNHCSGVEMAQQDKTLESSIDLKMGNISKLKISDGLQGGEAGLKENGGGNDGEINCAKSALEASNADLQLQNPDPLQLQNPCDYIKFSHEPLGTHYSGFEIVQQDKILESSIDLKMENVSKLKFSDGLQGEEVGLKESGGGNDGEINCAKPGLEASNSDRPLPCKERDSEGESDDEEESMSVVADSNCGDSSSDESSSDESSSIAKSVSSSEDDFGTRRREGAGEFEEGEVMEVGAHEIDILSDEEEEGSKGPIKSNHEMKADDLPLVPKIDVSLQPHHELLAVGVILSIMMNRVIVEGSVRHNPLDEGSILWMTDTRSPLGLVDEIFGPVKNPYYVVRYNTEEEVPAGVKAGLSVSFVVEFARQILNNKDLYKKGYDASGDNGEEVDNDLDFSDDEKEAEYKKSMHQGKRAANNVKGMKQEVKLDRKMGPFMKLKIQRKDMQKQQTWPPLSVDRPRPTNVVPPRPTNVVPPQPSVFIGQAGISPGSWNSSGVPNANLQAPSGMPEFQRARPAVNCIGNRSQGLNAGIPAPSRMPEVACNSSQQLSAPPQGAPWLPGISPQVQNAGFQGDLQMQLHNQNLLLNNLVNMIAFQQQLQQLIPHQGNNLPLFGAASPQLLGQSNFAPPPFVNGFARMPGTPGLPGPGNVQIQGQAPPPSAPFMQFNARNPSSLNSNGGSSRFHGRPPPHRGGGRFFGRGGRNPHR